MSNQIEPCAHCGSDNLLRTSKRMAEDIFSAIVICSGCSSGMTRQSVCRESAVEAVEKAWNKRVPLDRVAEVLNATQVDGFGPREAILELCELVGVAPDWGLREEGQGIAKAAPDLLKALERSLGWLRSARDDLGGQNDVFLRLLEGAISQAEGAVAKARGLRE